MNILGVPPPAVQDSRMGRTPGGQSRIAVIEAMRGIASVSVALFHFSTQLVSEIPVMFQSFGWLGVDVFFVISGFVIPLSLYGSDHNLRKFPRFLLRRLVRLEPPYLLSIVLSVLMWQLSAISPGFQGVRPDYSLAQIGFHLFYLIPLTHYSWLSPVYWSLAYEFAFYIIVGLAFSGLMNREVEWTILFAASIAAVFYCLESKFDVRILEFAVGVLLMRAVVAEAGRLRTCLWIAACLAMVFWTGGLKIGSAALLATGAIFLLRRVQYGKWAYYFGSISYSLYLTHVVIGGRVINLGRRFGDGALFECGLIVAALFASLLFAVLFSRLIEVPATRASRRIGSLWANVAAG